MNNNKGISIITLIITIVIIIILAGMSIYYGLDKNIGETTNTMSYNEIFDVSESVSQRTLLNRINPDKYKLIGEKLTDANPKKINEITYGDGWYELLAKESSKLGLENVKKNYVVNYKTGEVISYDPVYYENEEFFSSNDIKEAIGGETSATLAGLYDSVKGVNKPILVPGMIPVKNVSNEWYVTNADDEKWYDYSAGSQAWANIMLTDEITVEGFSTNEALRSASLSELEGKKVTKEGSMFVWIPRYTSNASNEIVYSNLTEDFTDEGFILNPAFTDGDQELTGIWISKYDADIK